MTIYIKLAPEVEQDILDARMSSRKAGWRLYTNRKARDKYAKPVEPSAANDNYKSRGTKVVMNLDERVLAPGKRLPYSCYRPAMYLRPFSPSAFLDSLPNWPSTTRLKAQHYIAIEMEGDGPTAEWRNTVAEIIDTLPADDSDIFLRAIDEPREADMAETFKPMVRYMNRPEELHERQPIASTWSIVPDNDNSPYAEDLNEDGRQEREYFNEINREVVPSVSEIMRQWQMQLKQPGTETKMMAGELRIVGGEDIAYGKARYHGDLSDQCVVRIGNLHFANGYQTEWAMVIDEGDVPVKKRTEVRQGGLLFTKERLVPSGAVARSAGQAAVNADIAAHLQVELPVRKPSGKRKGGKGIGWEDRVADLAKAYANTHVMPPITKCPLGLPANMDNVSEAFVAFKRGKCKGGGSQASWGDTFSEMRDREMWKQTLAEISEDDVEIIETSLTAANYSDIGKLKGYSGTYAGKAGKALLVAANDNMAALLKKYR